jgi:hypothetical protein
MKKYLLPLFALFFFANQVNAQLTANAGPDQTVCQNTTIILGGSPTASGGTGPYTYVWSLTAGLSSATVANPSLLVYGPYTYSLIVTDNVGAKDTDYVAVSVFPHATVYAAASDTNVCVGQPINFTSQIQSGTLPFTYAWNFGDGSTAAITSPTHVYAAQGHYQVSLSVTDSNSCVVSSSVWYGIQVSQVVATVIPVNVNCFGNNDGSLQAIATGGHPPYTYAWSNGSTVQNLTNIPVGTYTATITDSYGCSATVTGTVLQPALLVANITVTNESAIGACDGAIDLTVTGGVSPYAYAWSNGAVTEDIISLCSGTYSVTIVDANGCAAVGADVVTGSCLNNTLVVSINSQDLSCTHPTDTMTVNVTGGTPPYNFQWNTGDVNSEITVAQAGVYTVWVTDDSGCLQTAVDTLLNLGLVVALETYHPVSCNGNPDGWLNVDVTGGTPPYTYAWNTTPAQTADSITGLVSGTYSLTVTDAASCTATFSYFVSQNSSNYGYYAYTSATPANCSNNGTATVSVYGGTAPFSFLWSTSDTSQTLTGLSIGTYSVTVMGADGCARTGHAYVYSSCNNVIQGYAFNDANGNCVKDSGEAPIAGISITATGGVNNYYGYTGSNGAYTILIPSTGSFTLNISNYWGSCSNAVVCSTGPVTFGSMGDTAVANLGIGGTVGFDLALHPGWTSANPGFTKQYWVLIYQQSTPAYSGAATIIFKYDPILQYVSSNNGGVHNATNRTITWQVADASLYVPWADRPQAFLTVPANTPVGYQLTQEFWLLPYSGDCDTSDNHQVYTQPVTGSLDPNEKQVSPAGDILEEDSVLTYTIHFQNTGNDTTAFVILKDTLSTHLNPATIQNLASSHEYTSFDISENGILTWLFNPIFLVDSATNEPASKGFVTFRIKKKNGLPLNTQIKNSASIYFDYNEPIKTNTVSNRLTEPNFIYNVSNDAAINVIAAPNPFTQQTQLTVEGITGTFNFELFDVSGKLLKKINALADSRFTINRESMSAGVYFYSITTTQKQKAFGRLVVE